MTLNKTILIIDDDIDLQTLLGNILKKSGYKVMSLFDGRVKEAIRKDNLPDVILLDMDLPFANGVEVGKLLKANPETKDIPVIMISAHPNGDVLSKEAGVNDFMPKPLEVKGLLQKVYDKLFTKREYLA